MLDSTEKYKGSLLINLHHELYCKKEVFRQCWWVLSVACRRKDREMRNLDPPASPSWCKGSPGKLSPALQEEKELNRDLLNNDIGFELLPGKHSMEWFLHSVWLHSARSTQAAGNMTHQQPWTSLMCTQEEPLTLVPATPSQCPATLETVLDSQVLVTPLSHT